MFNLAEVWGYRPDGTNPCRHVPMFPNGKATHLISDEDMGKLFRRLEHIEAEGLENYVIPLAIRRATVDSPKVFEFIESFNHLFIVCSAAYLW